MEVTLLLPGRWPALPTHLPALSKATRSSPSDLAQLLFCGNHQAKSASPTLFPEHLHWLPLITPSVSAGNGPKDPHFPVPRTRECDLSKQRDFADVIKARISRWGDGPGLCRGTLNVIASILTRRQRERGDTGDGHAVMEMGGCHAEKGAVSRRVQAAPNLKEASPRILPWAFGRNRPCQH